MVVVVTSTNPVKINATKAGFEQVFPNTSIKYVSAVVESGVKDQPNTDQETLLGALTRVNNANRLYPDANYWVGLEGGVDTQLEETACFAWIVIKSRSHLTKSRSATFSLSPEIATLLKQGSELGDAMDRLHNRHNTKKEEGAVGILTHGLITRTDLYVQPLILALYPHKNKL